LGSREVKSVKIGLKEEAVAGNATVGLQDTIQLLMLLENLLMFAYNSINVLLN
jgi:hypothetical protein